MTLLTDRAVSMYAASAADVVTLAHQIRPDEMAQMCALRGWDAYDPEAAARWIISSLSSQSWSLVGRDGLAFMVGGLDLVRPGVCECWAIATESAWEKHWKVMTMQCRRQIRRALAGGAHRVSTVALASRTAAHEWYERGLGMSSEGVRTAYFANGADGVEFAITRRNG